MRRLFDKLSADEFKIASLEDIRALFPPVYNLFYAGFGNRDTDEIIHFSSCSRPWNVPPNRITCGFKFMEFLEVAHFQINIGFLAFIAQSSLYAVPCRTI
jgi:hypothetical protein